MKRLVDETSDELARSILTAGIEHRPPPGNKAQVIVALGAGGALGLFSSNAFAWLGTTAGKVTAVGVAVGVAGAVWVAAPPAAPPDAEARSSADASSANATAQLRASAPDIEAPGREAVGGGRESAGRAASSAARVEASPAFTHGGVDDTGTDARSADVPAPDVVSSDAPPSGSVRASADALDGDEQNARSSARRERSARQRAATRGKNLAKERVAASKQSELRRDGPLTAVEAPPAAGALDARSSEQANLDSEVRLVDDMHQAARRNDRDALGRFLARYRAAFPDGQLKKEVAEFATRLDRSDTSSAH